MAHKGLPNASGIAGRFRRGRLAGIVPSTLL